MERKQLETLLEGWARRVTQGHVGPQGYPSQSWSRAAVSRKGGPDNGLRTAQGSETRSFKPQDEGAAWGIDEHIEAGVSHLHASLPLLWAVGTAYYLGQVPMGYREAHKRRRRRIGRDDTTGLIQVRREAIRRSDEDSEATWKARLARRLTMTPRTFEYHLVRFHDCMALWVFSAEGHDSAKSQAYPPREPKPCS